MSEINIPVIKRLVNVVLPLPASPNITILNPEDTSVVSVTTARAVETAAEEELLEGEESAEPEVIGKGKSEDEEESEG